MSTPGALVQLIVIKLSHLIEHKNRGSKDSDSK